MEQPPAATNSPREFGFKVVRLARRYQARMDQRLKPIGLTHAKAVVLLYLANRGGQLQRELATEIGIEGPTLVRLLDSLEELELVERRDATHDRRSKTVHLTPQGAGMQAELEKILDEARAEILEGVTVAELDGCIRVCDQVADRFGNGT